MRIAWLTDIHLNFLLAADVDKFLRTVARQQADAVLLSGDIAESHNVVDYLARCEAAFGCPIYFVLGNHDFYYGSIARTRAEVAAYCRDRPSLVYLTDSGVIALHGADAGGPRVALVGHDGWADGRIGDFEKSLVMMNDYQLIEELHNLDKRARLETLHRLGDEAAERLRRVAEEALATYDELYVVTHVPPLREACWYEGEISNDEWAPHFTCKAIGQTLLDLAAEFRHRKITVFCGHTHGRGEAYVRPNLTFFTGAAEYGKPAIERVWEIGTL